MKKYKVNVNGTVYEITLEVMDGAPAAAPDGKRLFAFNDSRQSVQTERVLLLPSVSLLSPFKSSGLDLL